MGLTTKETVESVKLCKKLGMKIQGNDSEVGIEDIEKFMAVRRLITKQRIESIIWLKVSLAGLIEYLESWWVIPLCAASSILLQAAVRSS
ncbi:hypothetical protein V6N11_068161 [Hibiscus sabdariffa]|uniref:Uncharacterized protein n=1 Tax=Hibiscus sabdariffa TaxID=183260 RepID=A0ABR2STT6_9ROSI